MRGDALGLPRWRVRAHHLSARDIDNGRPRPCRRIGSAARHLHAVVPFRGVGSAWWRPQTSFHPDFPESRKPNFFYPADVVIVIGFFFFLHAFFYLADAFIVVFSFLHSREQWRRRRRRQHGSGRYLARTSRAHRDRARQPGPGRTAVARDRCTAVDQRSLGHGSQILFVSVQVSVLKKKTRNFMFTSRILCERAMRRPYVRFHLV